MTHVFLFVWVWAAYGPSFSVSPMPSLAVCEKAAKAAEEWADHSATYTKCEVIEQ
jgi:hypothetical protein